MKAGCGGGHRFLCGGLQERRGRLLRSPREMLWIDSSLEISDYYDDGINFSVGPGRLSEEFFLNQLGSSIQGYFKNELKNFKDLFPLAARLSRKLRRRKRVNRTAFVWRDDLGSLLLKESSNDIRGWSEVEVFCQRCGYTRGE